MTQSLLSHQIEQTIKDDILSGAFKSGEKISISDLEKKWGTSSTPIRDAIRTLASKGFLVVAPRESVRVANLNRKMIKEMFELKVALECAAVEIALPVIPSQVIEDVLEKCKTASRLFSNSKDVKHLFKIDFLVHQLIRDYCDNERLNLLLSDVSDIVDWARAMSANQSQIMEFAIPEQLHILNMLKRRDSVAAQEAMRIHLRNLYRRTIESIDLIND